MVTRIKLLLILSIILTAFLMFTYEFSKIVTPTVLAVADAEIRAKVTEIINREVLNEYGKQFNYNDIIKIEKDMDGNIVMLSADTLKLNKIACDVSINSQRDISQVGYLGVELQSGYIFKNNILAYIGPNIKVKAQPLGSVETQYISQFESAGINQTRHRIYVQVKTRLRIMLPMDSNNIEVKNEIPIAETIIVGKIPNTSIQMDLNSAAFKVPNENTSSQK
ncbi:MAG: sporulation protein YunB [Bacillota bacterium]|nr:sporulation protein YunB [Bacillota bacterium]